MKLLSFHRWINNRIALPLLGVGLILLVSQFSLFGYVQYALLKQQSDLIAKLVNVGREVILDGQTKLLTQVAAIAIDEARMESIVLCDYDDKITWSYPDIIEECRLPSRLGYKIEAVSLFPTTESYRFLIQVPKWPPALMLMMLMLAAVVIILGGAYLLWRIRSQIQKDLYFPIQKISDQWCQFEILELEDMRLNLQLLRKKEMDHAALVAFGNISTQVAHDIRSPLSSLQAALMLLREQCGDNKDTQDSLNLLRLSSQRLEGIANGLLAKHKGEAAESQFFCIHELLDELVGELQASPLGQGTEFKKQYHTSALYVTGDKTGMARAIGNIIKNALEAMQQTSVDRAKQLIVATAFDGNNLIIRITDTGPGIPANKIPLILQGGHTEGKSDGHGIGTKVIKEVVEAHKGQLSIESQVGVGTTFIITLPATIQNDETVVTIPNNANSAIYVIDDEPSLREQWRLTLKASGVTPKIYTCWEDFEKTDPSALPQDNRTFIIDYHFDNSEVDGLEIIRRLKARGYSHFVLATAEYWKPAIKDTALKLGAILCPKPLPRVVVQTENRHPREGGDPDSAGCRLVGRHDDEIVQEIAAGSGLDPSATPQDDNVEIAAAPAVPRTGKVGTTVLLIDDGEEIRLTWSALKKHLGIATLHSYPSLEAAIQASVDPSQCDLCVIDKNIDGSQYDGARMLEYLKQNGAKTVVLATGELESDIRKDPQFDTIDGIITDKIPRSIAEYL